MKKRRNGSSRWLPPPVRWVAAAGGAAVAADQAVLYALDVPILVALWELLWTGLLASIAVSGVFVWRKRVMEAETVSDRERDNVLQTDKLSLAGVLAAGIAHEIRNPLTSLRGFVQLQRDQQPQYTRIMLEEIDRINDIVSELLVLAKPKETLYEPKRVDRLLEDTMTLLQAQALLLGIELTASREADASRTKVLCDENKLKQVFINLVKNGMEAMSDGGTIHIGLFLEREWIVVTVTDEGCGMPAELLESLGTPFLSTKEGGSGLGLMVCGSIVEEHRGTIRYRSEQGKGTSVEVRLPAYG
ncbi:ATP-binding protein [Paenibacillus sp. TRM 82003]|nr:ATP-binding protein [Paenibacillus sp. TRM 82003]